MTNLILKLFVRDYKDTENPAVREKCGRVAGLVGIVTNLLLFAMKIAVGTLFSSVSITADAVNNLTDSGSSASRRTRSTRSAMRASNTSRA